MRRTAMLAILVGLVLIVVGAGVAYYGFQNPITGQTTNTTSSTAALISRESFTLQATQPPWVLTSTIQKGQVVTGIFGLTNYTTSQGPVFFYVQNETQLVNWGKCSPCDWPTIINETSPSTGVYQFTWTVPSNGAYYFSFDPEFYNATVPAYFDANVTTPTTNTLTTTSPNTTFIYSGIGLGIIGAIVLAAGVVLTTSKPRKQPSRVIQGATGSAEPSSR